MKQDLPEGANQAHDGVGGGSLADACIRHPTLAWVIMLVVVLFGAVAWTRIGVSQFPDVDRPTVSVRLTWEGANPEAMEREVVEIVEEALIQVEGIVEMKATCEQGSGSVNLTLSGSRNVDAAVQEVQTRIAQAQRRLPRDIDPPIVSKSNPDDSPIMWIGLSGPYGPRVLADYARYKIGERLQLLPGVGEVILGGNVERNIRIWLRPSDLNAHDLTATEALDAIARNHIELPAGELKGGGRSIPVRVLGEAADLETLRELRVGGTASSPVRLSDVAFVEDGFEDITRINRINGEPAQSLGIRKQRGANTIEVGNAVRGEIAQIQSELPEGMALGINYDSTPFISQSMDALIHEIGLAVLLTAIVCWLFLRSWSSTLNVILAIPMSLLGTVAVSWALGWTLNTFTLLGLGLAVGIVVDDAILVMENIVRRREMGESAPVAASRGTREVVFSALVATIAIIAIVMPVMFMRGQIGPFFLQFGVALSVAIIFSYVEAVTLAPARCARLLRDHPETVDHPPGFVVRTYARTVDWSVRHPWLIILGSLILLSGGVFLVRTLPEEFIPGQDQGLLRIRLTGEIGSSLEDVDALIVRAQDIILAHPSVARAYIATGGFGSGTNGGGGFLTLKPLAERAPLSEVMADLRKQLGSIPGLRVGVQDPSQSSISGSRGYPVDFALIGGDFAELGKQINRIEDTLTDEGLIVDTTNDYALGVSELRLEPDRARCMDLDVDLQSVANTALVGVAGLRVGKYSVGGRRIDIRASLVRDARDDPADLLALRVRSRNGSLIPLKDVVSSTQMPSVQTITRRDRERAVGIDANLGVGHVQGEVIQRVRELAKELPAGINLRLLGNSADLDNSHTEFLMLFVVGLLLAYLVLAAQFDSWAHPVTVLSILPLAAAGGVVALSVAGQSINLFSQIGFILLMGLAKKNSIVLVDFATREQARCGDAAEAMRRAAPIRLRPIIMTAVATIAGAMPIAIGIGSGSEIRRPMALCIVGGMIVATMLSLVVVPAVYVLVDRGRKFCARLFGNSPQL